ncbi:alanine racemase [Leuconostoc carnosum]|uniref:alanine racemase n=1 Tax=Leuconostoc carnosum TaxID=1252 RepID=UPI00345D30A8
MIKENDLLLTRPSWITVNLDAIKQNAQTMLKYTGAKRLIGVVKANAYGHGDLAVSEALYEVGVRDFAVATIDEGVRLRQSFINKDVRIILLGVQDVSQVSVMVSNQLEPAVGTLTWLQEAVSMIPARENLALQLAVDTGMGRMGVNSESELKRLYEFINANDKLLLSGVFTHFATADDGNQHYYYSQVQKFNKWVQAVGIPRKFWHLANSGSALWHTREIDTNTIRVGSVLYGFNPGAPLLSLPMALKPALTLKSKIGSVHQLQAGESVSYGATYTAQAPQWVATLPIGYADGYLRRMTGMKVLVDGHIEHVIGRVTMDQIVITLAHQYPVGQEVTLIGRDGDEEITIEDFAHYADTIPHEIVTIFGSRLPRVYE